MECIIKGVFDVLGVKMKFCFYLGFFVVYNDKVFLDLFI